MFGWLKRASWGLGAGAVLSLASSASAVMQPNGTTVPILAANITTCSDKNVEHCVDGAEGDPSLINALTDALVVPETFQPTCQLTFTPIIKGGTIRNIFGWYNVKEDPVTPGKFLKPSINAMYGMFQADGQQSAEQLAAVPPVVLDLGVEAAAGRYLGGQIGFFLVSGGGATLDPTTHRLVGGTPEFFFYTQHKLNVGSEGAQTFYNVLTWESVAHANTFYFGWEDLPANNGNLDNDFDDFVFSVEGVQCGGGGQPCDTGKMGVCAAGVLQCKKGVIECIQTIPEGAEICNALDDDCNGTVDDGELCEQGEICHRGVCVPRCGTGEFRCAESLTCSEGLCVEEACVDVVCDAGLVCLGGQCVDSCTGITCPFDRVCRNGGCIDPCVGIECDEGFACVLGVCSSCACSACADGQTCSAANQCVDQGCEGQTCAENTHCSQGACVDDCEGVICPDGQLCAAGECVADPNGTGNMMPGIGGSNGTPPIIGGGGTSSTGGKSGGGKNLDNKLQISEPACGCEVPGSSSTRGSAALLLLALVGLSRRRRAA
jgi:hypothetical protein